MDPQLEQIVNISYSFFAEKSATPETLQEFIRRARGFYPDYVFDDAELFKILEEIHSVRIDDSAKILEDSRDHKEWFNPDSNLTVKGEPVKWKFWDHYKQYAISIKHWSPKVVQELDRVSSLVLSRMENPFRPGKWDRRGMVVGGVQSGKTANYTAVLTKAADAGYKLFIVLAGVHNSLRAQTQDRLNHEFLGHELETIRKVTEQERKIGVWKMFPNDHPMVNTFTSNAENGDFKSTIAANAGFSPSPTGDPIVMVVKKIPSILDNLITWATGLGVRDKDGRMIVRNVPLVLIDDESDYASVNTNKKRENKNSGEREADPTKTNMKIRDLLSRFEKSVYIGYTATPYANIFIDKDEVHPVYGEDLFPKHFVISLPKPSNYVGPEDLFGLKGDPDTGIESKHRMPLLSIVKDSEKYIPSGHKSDLSVQKIPESLKKAIRYFIITCAVRRFRKRGVPHNSMLIHVTRYTNVQNQIRTLVAEYLKTLSARIMSGTYDLEDFREVWEKDDISLVKTSESMLKIGFSEAVLPSWNEIRTELFAAIRGIKIKTINGKTQDTLDYRQADRITREMVENGNTVPWSERGASIISIGGDKLSRGLTLEGLSISYYIRTSKMYDTLLQMGRWFGYHDGYNDLCRIFTTEELAEWYSHIALADRELLNELEYMMAIESTPEHFGLKVRDHPGRLAVTSAGKSRSAQKIKVTFAGRIVQTVVFDEDNSAGNLQAVKTMIRRIGRDPDVAIDPDRPSVQWKGISPDIVTDFLETYRTHNDAVRVADPSRYSEYIKKQLGKGELTQWDVAIVSNSLSESTHEFDIEWFRIKCVERTPLRQPAGGKVSIGVLTSPKDESIDLSRREFARALEMTNAVGKNKKFPTASTIKAARPPYRGLLLIYFPECSEEKDGVYGLSEREVTGFAISFPQSENVTPISYVVNRVFSEEDD